MLFDLYAPVKSSRWKDRKVGEIKGSERSHRRWLARRELKVEEEIEGPQREPAPVRLKCESQQGASSSGLSSMRVCVYVHTRVCVSTSRGAGDCLAEGSTACVGLTS